MVPLKNWNEQVNHSPSAHVRTDLGQTSSSCYQQEKTQSKMQIPQFRKENSTNLQASEAASLLGETGYPGSSDAHKAGPAGELRPRGIPGSLCPPLWSSHPQPGLLLAVLPLRAVTSEAGGRAGSGVKREQDLGESELWLASLLLWFVQRNTRPN